ncbi:Heat shock protein Hsp70 [Metarhizium brunneum]
MVRIAMVTLVAFAASAFASPHIRVRGGARVELARRTPAGEDTAAKQQAQIVRNYAKQLEQYAEQLEKGGGTETGNGQPTPNTPSGNGTETGNKPPTPSRPGSSPLFPGAKDDATGAGDGPIGAEDDSTGDGIIAFKE